MRILVIAVGCYFLVLIAFFVMGLGKIASLMGVKDILDNVNIIFQALANLATFIALPIAVFTYLNSERDKKIIRAKDSFDELKNLTSNLDEFIVNKWAIKSSFSKFENRISSLADEDRNSFKNDVHTLSLTLLKKIRPHHIFPIKLNDYQVGGVCDFEFNDKNDIEVFDGIDGFQKTVDAVANILLKKDMVHEFNGKFFIKNADSAFDVLLKIVEYAQPYMYRRYIDSKGALSFADFKSLSASFELIPGAILFLDGSSERDHVFNEIKEFIENIEPQLK